jgi:hypothetical protein
MGKMQQSVTVGTIDQLQKDYASVSYSTSDPFAVIWIGTVKLHDIYKFIEPGKNNQWRHHVMIETEIVVTVHYIGSKIECQIECGKLVVKHKPICNLTGHSHSKRIKCSNGSTYVSQIEAAQALGINQGAISSMLNGRSASASGYYFHYIND